MFSRGNITEKIRYGTQLVQKDEWILDMYAGIGYFTLPALIHGKAKHVHCCEWNPEAIRALQYNVRDNHVADHVTIWEGDCRVTIRDHPNELQHRFDRISLGLLPSSEGGWSSAILALRKDIGGWLHIHGNVAVKEVQTWSRWIAQSLQQLVVDHRTKNQWRNDVWMKNGTPCNDHIDDWMVLVVHVEKVKSFAPNVNHYVADVFVGPAHDSPSYTSSLTNHISKDGWKQFLDEHEKGIGCIAGVLDIDGQCIYPCTITTAADIIAPPSCALSPHGILHQAWLRSNSDKVIS
jgi:tRNA G37 N-methylase Trm5